MNILGISCYYHDSAACLLRDGEIVAASDEERFSRVKHDPRFPKKAIEFCLKKAGIKASDLDYVVFYEKPLLKFERLLLTTLAYSPKTLSFFKESMKEWFFDKLWVKSYIVSELEISPKKVLFCEHHLSHAASAFFCSPYEKAAILTIDGVGEWTTASWGKAEGEKIDLKEEIRFPNSLGLFYSVFTDFTGFEVNEGEYKMMGLSPYGKPKYEDEVRKLLDIKKDGSFRLNFDYFKYHYSLKEIYSKKFKELFGEKNRKPDEVNQYYADIAASVQKVSEEILISMAQYVHKKTNLPYLCYAGGVALNSAANWKILKKSGFDELYIQPSSGDSGGALGAALWTYHSVLGNKRNYVMNHAYLGEAETEKKTVKTLKKKKAKFRKIASEKELINKVAKELARGKVVGWVQDEFEWGPRALGHRSILADPRSLEMKDLVNRKIKFREAFRPFAPSINIEKASKYFETDGKKNHFPFLFMLYVLPVKKNKRKYLKAITHVDGTARPQFVVKKINPRYHALIEEFGKITKVPVILNTSFNLKGEPIVNTSEEAYETFMKSGLDLLVINNIVVEKKKIS